MNKWAFRDAGRRLSESVIRGKTKKELRKAKVFIENLLELKKVAKLQSTYVKGVRSAVEYNKANLLFTDFRLDGTVTGRLSCGMYKAAEAMGVSFHTLPRESRFNIRKFVTCPEGWDFITADYSTQEMRMMAHISGDANMLAAFERGEDLHTWTARLLFQTDNPTKKQRQIAKTVSFLIIYGGGAFNLAETMQISMKKAEDIVSSYRELYPRVFEYMGECADFIVEHKYAESIFGRRRHLVDIDSPNKGVRQGVVRQGVNFTVQSPASDVLLCAYIGINQRFIKERVEALVVATVHDSAEAISKKHHTKMALEIIHEEMTNYPFMRKNFGIELLCPLKVDLEVGTSFGTGKKVMVA